MSSTGFLSGLVSLRDDLATTLSRLLGLWVAYRLSLALYQISPLHPLHGFPGPKMAAMTFLYEFWYDGVRFGRYTWEIKKMHEKYGPIVRINPEELHCNDPDFADEIYAGGGRVRDKYQHFLNSNAGPLVNSSFGTRDHETHRMRRGAVNKSFSRGKMMELEPEVHQLVHQFCEKLMHWANKPIDMAMAYSCFTSDTISNYAYGEPLGFLAQDGWGKNYKEALNAFLHTMYFFRFFTPARHLVHIAPYVQRWMPAHMANLFREMTETLPMHISRAIKGQTEGRIFADLINSGLPDSEKTIERLSGEGFSLTGAGTETTANTLTVITYHLLTQPTIFNRLADELGDLNPMQLDWTTLEQRPYLWAVMQEGLRLSYGLCQRLPRIARTENLVYQQKEGAYKYVIPMGTPVGMSSVIMHHNEEIFPRSEEYRPQRWLDKDGRKNQKMEKYIMSFSKGSRQCLGMNLALCELYLVLAALVLRVMPKMQLYETTIDDIKYDHDLMVPQPKSTSKGVRVVIS